MITFLEYSYNLEQVASTFKKMAGDKVTKPASHKTWILGFVPADFIEKLPDGARFDAAMVIRKIILDDVHAWDEVGDHIKPLWDQPIPGPGKTLGGDLLNKVSAKVKEKNGAEFFMSYSGDLSRGEVHSYTKGYPRVFASKSNYRWGPYRKVFHTISGDYAQHFNNYRQLQVKK